MKPHLPVSLRVAVLTALAAATSFTASTANAYEYETWDTPISAQNATLSSYEVVDISNNATTKGGAIDLSSTGSDVYTVNITDSGAITLASNTSTSGGAVYCDSNCVLNLQDNLSVSFTDNTVTTGVVYGGAIHIVQNGTVNIDNSGTVMFSGNKAVVTVSAYYEDAYAFGAAICNKYGTLGFTGNKGGIVFADNVIEGRGTEWGYSVQGGALYNDSRNETFFTDNGNITFSGKGKAINPSTGDGIFGAPSNFLGHTKQRGRVV